MPRLSIQESVTVGVGGFCLILVFDCRITVNTSNPFDWRVMVMNLDIAIKKPLYQVNTELNTQDIRAAKGFSYHCSDPPNIAPSNGTVQPSGKEWKVSLTFKGLQV